MKLLIKKEWKLTVTPVPLLFLLLSALVLVPSYPYYITFFYNALGIFLMLQAARENRDVYYMALLPLTKRDLVRAFRSCSSAGATRRSTIPSALRRIWLSWASASC